MIQNKIVILLLVSSLLFSIFPFVTSDDISIIKPVVYLKDYNEFGEITKDGFIFHLYLEVEKDNKEFTKNDFTGYIGQSNIDSFNYTVDKKIISEDKDKLLFDYEIHTPFFVGGFDYIPVVKNYPILSMAWFNSSFGYKKQLVIDHTQVPSSLINFPVLVNLSDWDLKNYVLNVSGLDIVFVNDDEDLMFEREI